MQAIKRSSVSYIEVDDDEEVDNQECGCGGGEEDFPGGCGSDDKHESGENSSQTKEHEDEAAQMKVKGKDGVVLSKDEMLKVQEEINSLRLWKEAALMKMKEKDGAAIMKLKEKDEVALMKMKEKDEVDDENDQKGGHGGGEEDFPDGCGSDDKPSQVLKDDKLKDQTLEELEEMRKEAALMKAKEKDEVALKNEQMMFEEEMHSLRLRKVQWLKEEIHSLTLSVKKEGTEASRVSLLKRREEVFTDFTKSLKGLPVDKKKAAVTELKVLLMKSKDSS